tara:strand:- start:328 stop:546 length:219 start_codon:yes stop_codon:yes gene_type:complete
MQPRIQRGHRQQWPLQKSGCDFADPWLGHAWLNEIAQDGFLSFGEAKMRISSIGADILEFSFVPLAARVIFD